MLTREELLEIEKKLLRRTEDEFYRREKHSNARLVTYSEYTPEMFLRAFNRSKYNCISLRDEGKKNEDIPEFKLRKIYFALTWIIVYASLYTIIITRMIKVGNGDSLKELSTILMLIAVGLIFVLPTLTVASIIKYVGMPPFNAYLYGDTKFYRLSNGQIGFADIRKKGYVYSSMFDNYGEIFHTTSKNTVNMKNTEIRELYVPSKIISVKMTRNGILLESSGLFYGLRNSRSVRKGSTNAPVYHFEAWSEMNIDYRKEVIPVTWTNIEGLYRELLAYDNDIVEKPIKID